MSVTVLVEPSPGGHRFQAVANVAAVAGETAEVVLLTSKGAGAAEEFSVYLEGTPLRVVERFDSITPPTATVLAEVAELLRTEDVTTLVLMDADQDLKRWWFAAPRAFRGLRRPRVVFMLTRYPARMRLTDWAGGWRLRGPKAVLAVAARATGVLHHVAGFAGRDDMARGWVVRRARDPEICTAHSRDRDQLRKELDLPADRRIVGIYGGIGERKNAKLVFESLKVAGIDADLLLAGGVAPEVWAWIDALPPEDRARLIVRDGFLSNELLDKLMAASDVAPIVLTNNGPSGIMGKAAAAGVPVVTAGSKVRERELLATDGGESAEFTAESIGAAIQRVFDRDPDAPRRNTVPPATADEFSRSLLGVDAQGRVEGRGPRNRRNRRS